MTIHIEQQPAIGNVIVSGTSGSILYVDSSGNLAQDNSNLFWDASSKRLGLATAAPSQILSLGGESSQTIWMERRTASNSGGNFLTIQSGGATSGATDKAGGNLVLKGGASTGTGAGGALQFSTYLPNVSGTSDNTATTIFSVDAYGNLLLGGVDVNSEVNDRENRGALFFDLSNAGNGGQGRAMSLHSIYNIGTKNFTAWIRLMVPSSNPSLVCGILGLTPSSTTATATARAFRSNISTGGALQVDLYGATATDLTSISLVENFVTNYGGKVVDLVFVRDAGTPSFSVYINGRLHNINNSSSGTPPTWAGLINSTYAMIGNIGGGASYTDRICDCALFNYALSASQIIGLREHGISRDNRWGSLTPVIDYATPLLNGGFETAGAGGADIWANWVETITGSSTLADETTIIHSGAHSMYMSVDALGSSAQVKLSSALEFNTFYVAEGWIYADKIGNIIQVGDGGGAGNVFNVNVTQINTWQYFSSTFKTRYNVRDFVVKKGLTSDVNVYVDDLVVTKAGILFYPDFDTADVSKSCQILDRSPNAYNGTFVPGLTQVRTTRYAYLDNPSFTGVVKAPKVDSSTMKASVFGINEGASPQMGMVKLSAGTATVTANVNERTRIFLTPQDDVPNSKKAQTIDSWAFRYGKRSNRLALLRKEGRDPRSVPAIWQNWWFGATSLYASRMNGIPRVMARDKNQFTITSTDATDSGRCAWLCVQPS